MKTLLGILIAGMLVCGLAACGSSGDSADTSTPAEEAQTPAADASHEGHDHADAVPAAMTVEAGCAMCVYHMEGVEGCVPAVVIGGEPLLLTGVEVEGHALCTGAKEAMVTGAVQDGQFVASNFELK